MGLARVDMVVVEDLRLYRCLGILTAVISVRWEIPRLCICVIRAEIVFGLAGFSGRSRRHGIEFVPTVGNKSKFDM